jgi:hypothetical protein
MSRVRKTATNPTPIKINHPPVRLEGRIGGIFIKFRYDENRSLRFHRSIIWQYLQGGKMKAKQVIKIVIKSMMVLIGILILFIFAYGMYHRYMLAQEESKLEPPGVMVEVNGHQLHVYAEGSSESKPTLVFMSGSGTIAPVYDFRILYSKLSEDYRIAVVEKAGYGYSEIVDIDRDVNSVLEETRSALSLAGESGPYILMPHSYSGLEAIYWAQMYPEEIQAIIGLDMAVPETFLNQEVKPSIVDGIYAILLWMGVQRIPGVYDASLNWVSDTENQQLKYLLYKNALNIDIQTEGLAAGKSSKLINEKEIPKVDIIQFVSTEKMGANWISCQEQFSKKAGSRIDYLDCGHYIFYYQSEYIADTVKEYIKNSTKD